MKVSRLHSVISLARQYAHPALPSDQTHIAIYYQTVGNIVSLHPLMNSPKPLYGIDCVA